MSREDLLVLAACGLAIPVFCGVIGGAIGHTRGRLGFGLTLGLLLGPIGWLILCLLPAVERVSAAKTQICPACQGEIHGLAWRCKHCGFKLAAPPI